jgi:hypothetical protein
LIKKMLLQAKCSIKKPPEIGPTAIPSPDTRPRRRSPSDARLTGRCWWPLKAANATPQWCGSWQCWPGSEACDETDAAAPPRHRAGTPISQPLARSLVMLARSRREWPW